MNTKPADSQQNASAIRRVLIVGVSGYLGSALAEGLKDEFEVFGTYYSHPIRIEGVTCLQMNCIHGGQILDTLNRYRPEIVLYCAGFSDTKICQDNPGLAEGLHFKAPTVFFKILPVVIRLLYLTPDISLGSPKVDLPPFSEQVLAAPHSILAKTRQQGLVACLGAKRYTTVFRYSEVFGESFGWATHKKGPWNLASDDDELMAVSAPYWMEEMVKKVSRGQSITLSSNIVKSYLYVGDFVRAVRAYLRKPTVDASLYHIGAKSSCSQLELGRLICSKLGYNPALVKDSSFEEGNWSLNPAHFTEEFEFEFQSVPDAVEEYAERLRTGFTKAWT